MSSSCIRYKCPYISLKIAEHMLLFTPIKRIYFVCTCSAIRACEILVLVYYVKHYDAIIRQWQYCQTRQQFAAYQNSTGGTPVCHGTAVAIHCTKQMSTTDA